MSQQDSNQKKSPSKTTQSPQSTNSSGEGQPVQLEFVFPVDRAPKSHSVGQFDERHTAAQVRHLTNAVSELQTTVLALLNARASRG